MLDENIFEYEKSVDRVDIIQLESSRRRETERGEYMERAETQTEVELELK